MQRVQTPVIPVIGSLIAHTPGTISLGQGAVGYGPPQAAIEAYSSFLADPEAHRYGPVEGLPALVEAVASKLRLENQIDVGKENRVVVTAGGNMAFMNAVLAITDPGDEIVFPVPYYFNHEMAVVMAGCRPVPVLSDPHYQLDLDAIRTAMTPRTRAVVTVSPNNPSGAVYPEETIRAVNTLCREAGVYHIHDEAYEYFTYEGVRHFSPGSIAGAAPYTISLYSLSKAYGFASWRIGYMVIPEALLSAVNKIQDTILICPPTVSQHAAIAALRVGPAYCRQKLAELAEVRKVVLARFAEVADVCTVPAAQGAFYCLMRVTTSVDSFQLATRLITEHGVAVIPGSAFGLSGGCYARVSYGSLGRETVNEGMDRLVRGLNAIARV